MFRTFSLILLALSATLRPEMGFAEITVTSRLAEGQSSAVIAHRSADLGGYPEQSLAAISHAISIGTEIIHLNPQLTKDGQYVLMHDATLNRTTNVEQVFPDGPPSGPTRTQRGGRDYVRDYTVDEISQLRLANGASADEYTVPTLENALELIDGQAIALLGLKAYEAESLADTLSHVSTERLLLFAVYYADSKVLRDISEKTGIGAVISMGASKAYDVDLNRLIEATGPQLRMICADSRKLTPQFLQTLHENKLALCISGWNHREDSALVSKNDPGPWMSALQSGATAVMTDHPKKVLDLISD